jgi:hypothetical protein
MIKMTINININVLNSIEFASIELGTSRSKIIKLLMKEIKLDKNIHFKFFSQVKYQEKDFKKNWSMFHIKLSESEYEYFLDIRKFFKMSVSLILAFAVKKYLHLLLKSNSLGDNYSPDNYFFQLGVFQGKESFIISWGNMDKFCKMQVKEREKYNFLI